MNIQAERDTEVVSSSRKRKSRGDGEEEYIHMVISSQERGWAKALKEALLTAEDTKTIPISDMELVQYAIVEQGNIQKCLERIRRMHLLKTTYGILDTPEQGLECVQKFMQQQPLFSMYLDHCPQTGRYVHVCDLAQFHPSRVSFDRDWKVFLSGIYYFCTALNPTLSAVRDGVIIILETDGMGWDNFCMDFEQRLWHEHASAYPFHISEFCWVNTPLVGNVFYSLLKPILPQAVRDAVRLGVKFDDTFDQRLDALFLQPNIEVSIQRQLEKLWTFLERRYRNQKHFRLDP